MSEDFEFREIFQKYIRINLLLSVPSIVLGTTLAYATYSRGFCLMIGRCPNGFYEMLAYNAPTGFFLGIFILPFISAIVFALLNLAHKDIESEFTRTDRYLALIIALMFIFMVPVSLGWSNYLEIESDKENCRNFIEQRPENSTVDFSNPQISEMCFENGEPKIEELKGFEVGDVVEKTESGYQVVEDGRRS